MSRPSSLTPKVSAAIVTAIEQGASLDTAAALAGVAPSTLYAWRKRGRAGEQPFVEFLEATTRARAVAIAAAIAVVREAKLPNGSPDWRAQAWWLERIAPEDFGRTAAVNALVRAELDGALERLAEVLPPGQYERALSALAGEEGELAAQARKAEPSGRTFRVEFVSPERPKPSEHP